jgi:PAS domain S-box-containing protein
MDWSGTPLGAVEDWPSCLRTLAGTVLACRFPMVLLWGEDLVQIYNDGYSELMGARHPAGLGQHTRDCWPEVWNVNEPIYARVFAGESVVLEDALFRVRREHSLEDAYFTLCYSPVPDEAGGVRGVLVTVFETTAGVLARQAERERCRAAQALSESEESLRIALQAADLGTWDLDLTTGSAPVRSLRHDQMFGYEEPQQEWGQAIAKRHVLPEDQPVFDEAFARASETGLLSCEVRVRWPDGSIHWIAPLGRTYYGDDGRPLRMAGVVADITERKRAAETVERARVAERASLAKSQFLGVMSHELRTPLNAILGYADLLLAQIRGPLTPGQEQQVERIRAGGRHLLELIEEVLVYARIEGGGEEVHLDPTDVTTLVLETAELVRPITDRKGLALVLQLPAEPVALATDARKLRQILLNLLGNAAKFTDHGSIAVTLRVDGGAVRIDVADTGSGVPPDHVDAIWEPFRQVDSANTRQKGGTGLGLAVSRQLARLLGGDVVLDSPPGGGSTFTLSLPLRELPEQHG